jgi:hypothetical protein
MLNSNHVTISRVVTAASTDRSPICSRLQISNFETSSLGFMFKCQELSAQSIARIGHRAKRLRRRIGTGTCCISPINPPATACGKFMTAQSCAICSPGRILLRFRSAALTQPSPSDLARFFEKFELFPVAIKKHTGRRVFHFSASAAACASVFVAPTMRWPPPTLRNCLRGLGVNTLQGVRVSNSQPLQS